MTAFAKASRSLALGMLIVTGAAVSAAQAITDTGFFYSPAKTGYRVIGPADAVPFSVGTSYINEIGGGLHPVSNVQACFSAPVHLPQAARITQVAIWYKSGSGGAAPGFQLSRVPLGTPGDVRSIASAEVSDDSNTIHVITPHLTSDSALLTVGNTAFIYEFRFCLYVAADTFYGARIQYTYTSAGD